MRYLYLFLCLILISTGCAQQQQKQEQKKQSKTQAQSMAEKPECNPTPIRYFHSEQQVKKLSEQINGVDQAIAVRVDNELHVALKVTNFDRLRLNALRKKTSKKLKAYYVNDDIHVTTDAKLFNELEKLNKKAWSNNKQKACKQKKELKDIEKKMRG